MSRGSLNKVMLIGNLGADPETRYTPSNMAITKIRIATSESWKDKNTGEAQERTEWHRVTLFGKLGEIAQQYLRKGSKVYIEGQLETRKWQDQSGQEKYSTEVVLRPFRGEITMLDTRAGGGGDSGGDGGGFGGGDVGSSGGSGGGRGSAPARGDLDDDIPF